MGSHKTSYGLFFCLLLFFLSFPYRTHAQASLDPGVFQVIKQEYGMGASDDEIFLPSGFPGKVEIRGSVHYPTQLSRGPFPLVVMLHGWHDTCFKDSVGKKEWPCDRAGGWQPIPSYAGYDHMASNLASHGYIVVSISANGITANDQSGAVLSVTMRARAELIQQHLALWHTWNISGSGPFGSKFVGAIDTKNIGLMGHSRGGEGVAAYHHYFQNASYKVKAALLFAPNNAYNFVVDNIHLGIVLPYCDGDIAELSGIRYYDSARYSSVADETNKHLFLVMGANHNFFNSVWTPGLFPASAQDDFSNEYGSAVAGSPVNSLDNDYFCSTKTTTNMRLTDLEQRSVGSYYFSAFFMAYLGGDSQALRVLTGDDKPSFLPVEKSVHVSYQAGSKYRLDVNRMDMENLAQPQNNREIINTLGGNVFSSSGLAGFDICGDQDSSDNDRFCIADVRQCDPDDSACETNRLLTPSSWQQPHALPGQGSNPLRLSQLLLEWFGSQQSGGCGNAAYYENSIPEVYKNIRRYSHLQFRAGINFQKSPYNVNQDFSIELRDSYGNKSCISVSDYSDALFFPPGYSLFSPKLILNTVNVPLSAFKGVDLSSVVSVRLVFDKTYAGAIAISDISFSNIYQKSRGANLINIINTAL